MRNQYRIMLYEIAEQCYVSFRCTARNSLVHIYVSIRIYILLHTSETNTTLLINHTPIENKNDFKKERQEQTEIDLRGVFQGEKGNKTALPRASPSIP